MKSAQQQKQVRTLIIIVVCLSLVILYVIGKKYQMDTYRDPHQRFTIRYPSGWEVVENHSGAAVIFKAPKQNELDVFQENISVIIQDLSGNPQSIDEYSARAVGQMKTVFGSAIEEIDAGSYSVGGYDGYYYSFIGKGPEHEFQYTSAWTVVGTKAYQVTLTAIESQHDKYLTLYNRSLNSLRIR